MFAYQHNNAAPIAGTETLGPARALPSHWLFGLPLCLTAGRTTSPSQQHSHTCFLNSRDIWARAISHRRRILKLVVSSFLTCQGCYCLLAPCSSDNQFCWSHATKRAVKARDRLPCSTSSRTKLHLKGQGADIHSLTRSEIAQDVSSCQSLKCSNIWYIEPINIKTGRERQQHPDEDAGRHQILDKMLSLKVWGVLSDFNCHEAIMPAEWRN